MPRTGDSRTSSAQGPHGSESRVSRKRRKISLMAVALSQTVNCFTLAAAARPACGFDQRASLRVRMNGCVDLERAQSVWDGAPHLAKTLSREDFVIYAQSHCAHPTTCQTSPSRNYSLIASTLVGSEHLVACGRPDVEVRRLPYRDEPLDLNILFSDRYRERSPRTSVIANQKTALPTPYRYRPAIALWFFQCHNHLCGLFWVATGWNSSARSGV